MELWFDIFQNFTSPLAISEIIPRGDHPCDLHRWALPGHSSHHSGDVGPAPCCGVMSLLIRPMEEKTAFSNHLFPLHQPLTHWGRVTHICVNELTIIGSDNGLSHGRRQAIIWNNAGLLLIVPLGTNFSEISIGIQTFSYKKMHLNMSSAKWRPFCLGLNVLTDQYSVSPIYCGWWGPSNGTAI